MVQLLKISDISLENASDRLLGRFLILAKEQFSIFGSEMLLILHKSLKSICLSEFETISLNLLLNIYSLCSIPF